MSNSMDIYQNKLDVNIIPEKRNIDLKKSDINVEISQNNYSVDINSSNYDITFKGEMRYSQVEFKWAEVPESRNSPGVIGMMAMNDEIGRASCRERV